MTPISNPITTHLIEITDIINSNVIADNDSTATNEIITDAKYLEMAEDMKRVVDAKDEEVKKYKKEAIDYKHTILQVYGIVHYIADVLSLIDMDELFPADMPLGDLMEVVRAKLEKKIL